MAVELSPNLNLQIPDKDELMENWSGVLDQFDDNLIILANAHQSPGVGVLPTYTPVLTATTTNPTLGTGAVAEGFYYNLGPNLVIFWGRLRFGTSGVNPGNGFYVISLPVAIDTLNGVSMGVANLRDETSAVNTMSVTVSHRTSTAFDMYKPLGIAGTKVSHNSPFVWDVNDAISFMGMYQTVAI